jgi:hypothetical protein
MFEFYFKGEAHYFGIGGGGLLSLFVKGYHLIVLFHNFCGKTLLKKKPKYNQKYNFWRIDNGFVIC